MKENDIAFSPISEYGKDEGLGIIEALYYSFTKLYKEEIEPVINERIMHYAGEERPEEAIADFDTGLIETDRVENSLDDYFHTYRHLIREIESFANDNELGTIFRNCSFEPYLLTLDREYNYYVWARHHRKALKPTMLLQAIAVTYVTANELVGLCRYTTRSYSVLKFAYRGSKLLQFTWADYFNYINMIQNSVVSTIMYNMIVMVLRKQNLTAKFWPLNKMEKTGIAFADFAYKRKTGMNANVKIQPLSNIVDPELNHLYDSVTMNLRLEDAFGLKVAGFEYAGKDCLAFAGTRLNFKGIRKSVVSMQNIFTDLIQIAYKATPAYMAAVGIVEAMLTNDKDVNVFGHSLGGGLMQFACAGNSSKRVHGYGYNAAGLSPMTCDLLSKNGVYAPLNNIVFVNASTDVVSKIGIFLGLRKLVDTSGMNMLVAHKIETLNKKVNRPLLYC